MKYKYTLIRLDRPTSTMKTNNINGLVRVTNNYRRLGIKYRIVKGEVKWVYLTKMIVALGLSAIDVGFL